MTATVSRLAWRTLQVVALPVLLILLWWYASVAGQNYYLPTPGVIASTFGDTWFGPRMVDDALPSVARLLTGFTLAGLLGVGLGVLIGSSPKLRAFTEPVLEFLRAIPPPVLVPLLILLAGIDSTMKVLVIISGCIWPVLLNTVEGVRAVDPVLADTCRAYGIRGSARLRTLVLRSASPQIMAGLRQALSIAIILMVISEMFASSSGLGFTIVQFQRGFAIPEMWTGIVLLGLLGFGLSVLFGLVERRVLAWYLGLRQASRGDRTA
jgi:ABC-type nitrate/sulfonate/bicarbonate transport system permease component